MKRIARPLLVCSALALLGAGGAWAQGGPESLLPPGFDRPAPRPSRAPVAAAAPVRPGQPRVDIAPTPEPTIAAQPVVEASSGIAAIGVATASGPVVLPQGISSFEQLIALSPDKLDRLLGLIPKYDIPPGAQRAMKEVGLLDAGEGGMAPQSLAGQNAGLVRAVMAGNNGQMVSRWGHILVRRALASRLDAPAEMAPAEFAALRAALLLRMGEGVAARALVQDVDPVNYDASLTQAAMDAYIATGDFTGFCPVLQLNASARDDVPWQVMRSICQTYGGATATGQSELDRLGKAKALSGMDMELAQKYAGAVGGARARAVKIEWDNVNDLTPMRHGLTLAVGLAPPDALLAKAGPIYADMTALSPMAGLGLRADAADVAGAMGVLSGAAMVDLYSQIYSNDDITGGPAERALLLRDAYVGVAPADRVAAMQQLWDGAANPYSRYARMVLTAYAAARLAPSADLNAQSGDLIASMLSAGLDGNAALWRPVVEAGSPGWAQLALGLPMSGEADTGAIESFIGNDKSDGQHRSAMLIAALSGLGRIKDSTRDSLLGKVKGSVAGQTRWTGAIDTAAGVNNPALVALLAGLGMQGDSWAKMTPRYLYHITSALNRVGMGAEARMIAAEAVARG
ncbi:hypothetical protein [Novosphingobium sediminicola]|uniref:Antifreeze glycopeptide polyprotein n=1 Tax=Novosphingobium sediminicola TaxID=563162 RepID=A0A7W6CF11_9SPHN|nr:hypothetical protein [Novosphingobium sediminicola]MBB3953479.1 hypothetical protein [Novosphingobium sediminicola]